MNEVTFYFTLNDGRRFRSPEISLLYFLISPTMSCGAQVRVSRWASQRFVFPRRVCPPAITASTCRTQRELFQNESSAESIIREVRGTPRRRFLIRSDDMRFDVFGTKSPPPFILSNIVFRQCVRLTFLARPEVRLRRVFCFQVENCTPNAAVGIEDAVAECN